MGPSTVSDSPAVLLVESSAIIGLDLADGLEGLGYGVAGPYACVTALQWLETSTPHIAVLDVDLRSGPCLALARELRARRVPILVFSSHDRTSSLAEFHDLAWLSMPAPISRLDAALRALVADRGSGPLPGGPAAAPAVSSAKRDRTAGSPEAKAVEIPTHGVG
jgi:DNA-binding response OmpR family regulator